MKPLFPNLKKHLGKRIVKSMMWSGIIAVTATISAGIGASLVIMKPFSVQIANFKDKLNEKKSVVSKAQSSSNELTRSVNILILGLDNSPFRLNKTGKISSVPHNDAVFVMRFEAADNSVKILNLPAQITANNLVKFDQKDYSRPALTTRIVSKSLNNLPIERYLRFNTQAVAELIDLLGGVEVFVAAKMTYTDHAQNLQIDIPPGWQNLDGNRAQQFIRFLDEKGETARRERQQILLQALHRRLTSPSISSRLGEIVPLFKQQIETNLTLAEIVFLVKMMSNLPAEKLQIFTLPSQNKENNYAKEGKLAVAKRDLILSEYFNHSDSSVQTVANRRASKGLTINIQNTTNEIGLGGRVSALLTEADYTNLKIIPTQPEMLAKSKIIIQPESLATGKALKEILGFGKLEITKFGNLDAQLTILLGEDAKQLLSKDSFLE